MYKNISITSINNPIDSDIQSDLINTPKIFDQNIKFLEESAPSTSTIDERKDFQNKKTQALAQVLITNPIGKQLDLSTIDLNDIDFSDSITSDMLQYCHNPELYTNMLASIDSIDSQYNPQKVQLASDLIKSLMDFNINTSSITHPLMNILSQDTYCNDTAIAKLLESIGESTELQVFKASTSRVDAKNNYSDEKEECNNVLKKYLQGQPLNFGESDYLLNLEEIDWSNCMGMDLDDINSSPKAGESQVDFSADDYKLPTISGYENAFILKDKKNEFLANASFILTRNRFKNLNVKSGNKVKPAAQESVKRLERATPQVINIQKNTYALGTKLDFTRAMAAGAGNCGEMAGISAQIINNSGGYARQYLVDDKGTHAFTLVGIPPRTATDNVHFSDYTDCWALDPWAGIVCKADEYTQLFIEKMNKWESDGKLILDNGQWISPNNKNWCNAVSQGNKVQNYGEANFDNPVDLDFLAQVEEFATSLIDEQINTPVPAESVGEHFSSKRHLHSGVDIQTAPVASKRSKLSDTVAPEHLAPKAGWNEKLFYKDVDNSLKNMISEIKKWPTNHFFKFTTNEFDNKIKENLHALRSQVNDKKLMTTVAQGIYGQAVRIYKLSMSIDEKILQPLKLETEKVKAETKLYINQLESRGEYENSTTEIKKTLQVCDQYISKLVELQEMSNPLLDNDTLKKIRKMLEPLSLSELKQALNQEIASVRYLGLPVRKNLPDSKHIEPISTVLNAVDIGDVSARKNPINTVTANSSAHLNTVSFSQVHEEKGKGGLEQQDPTEVLAGSREAMEAGLDNWLVWLKDAEAASWVTKSIFTGKNECGGALIVEEISEGLLTALQNKKLSPERAYSALFPTKKIEKLDFLNLLPQLMSQPAGVRLSLLLNEFSSSKVVAEEIKELMIESCVLSQGINRKIFEKNNFYNRVNIIGKNLNKLNANDMASNENLKEFLPQVLHAQSLFTESLRLLAGAGFIMYKEPVFSCVKSDNKNVANLRKAVESSVRIQGHLQFLNRPITRGMLQDAQLKDNVSYARGQAGTEFWLNRFAEAKVSSDIKSTARQHEPEPEWVKCLHDFAKNNVKLAKISGLQKEMESEIQRIKAREESLVSNNLQPEGFNPVSVAIGLAMDLWAEDQQSMLRPAGRDIGSMTREGELQHEIANRQNLNTANTELHSVWAKALSLLESGVPEKYQENLLSVMGVCETAILANNLETYVTALKTVNEENVQLLKELSANERVSMSIDSGRTAATPVAKVEKTIYSPDTSAPVKKPSRSALLA